MTSFNPHDNLWVRSSHFADEDTEALRRWMIWGCSSSSRAGAGIQACLSTNQFLCTPCWKMLQEQRAEIRLWEKGNIMCRPRDSRTGHCRYPEEHGPFLLLCYPRYLGFQSGSWDTNISTVFGIIWWSKNQGICFDTFLFLFGVLFPFRVVNWVTNVFSQPVGWGWQRE